MPKVKCARPLRNRERYYKSDGHLTLMAFEEGYCEEYECDTQSCTFNLFLDVDQGVFRVRGAHYHTHWGPERIREDFSNLTDAVTYALKVCGSYLPPEDAFSGI